MVIGVPRETHRHEHRVGLTPLAISRLTKFGYTVLIERNAGVAAHFTDQHFGEVGAQIVYSADEVYKRADIVCRVGVISTDELDLLKQGSVVCAFHHLAVQPREKVERLMELETTLIGYELIRDENGEMPVLVPFSEMAGQMAIPLAAHYLQTEKGGRGILMGNVPGVPPPTVLILGAGSVGLAAARSALLSGAHVVVLDDHLANLRTINRELSGQVVTAVSNPKRLNHYTAIADVVIGAILVPGERTPYLVTEEMVKAMRTGSVIIDISIDQGGCVETSRPTSIDDPTFIMHDVVHYCVPNMTANIARTASRILADAALPYIIEMAEKGVEAALRDDPGLGESVFLYKGRMVNQGAGEVFEIPATPLRQLMEEG
ncbi:MAG: alanine dehydrogenase [Candidatus Latescibacteria bacterium]|nr:alanine dehydrogenase [Candidatus Latescibacterota bacterium]